MKINITRKPKNTRFGSLAWAATLPADKWYWKFSHRGDTTNHIDVYNGDLLIASICDYDLPVAVEHLLDNSIAYGGAPIGMALLTHIVDWAETLDLNVDDQGKMQFISV